MKYDREIYLKIDLQTEAYRRKGILPMYKGDLEVRDLRITFNVQRTYGPMLTTATIKIWNLSKDKRNELAYYGDRISIYAGYKQETGAQLVFRGNTSKVIHAYNEPDMVSSFNCADGDNTINNTMVHLSFGANCKAKDVIQKIADELNLKIISPLPPDTIKYDNGYSNTGGGEWLMDDVCKYAKYNWSVQNEFIVLVPKDGSSPRPIIEINSGME